MWIFTFRRWTCFYLLFCSYVQLLLANWRDFAAIVTVLLTRAVGFVGSAGPFRLCFTARAHQEGTLDPMRTGHSAAQVRDAPMIQKRSVWALWPWDCVMVKISLQWALNSVYWFWFFFTPFSVRKCQSKDNHKSSKLFSDESPCCQLNTWLHLHRKQPRKPPGRVGLELLEPLWLLPVWGWACAAVPAGSSCFPSLAPPAQSCHSE